MTSNFPALNDLRSITDPRLAPIADRYLRAGILLSINNAGLALLEENKGSADLHLMEAQRLMSILGGTYDP